jgi:hypothetical protein
MAGMTNVGIMAGVDGEDGGSDSGSFFLLVPCILLAFNLKLVNLGACFGLLLTCGIS